MLEVYREINNVPQITFSHGRLGITHLDFYDENICILTYTDDLGNTKEERFSYLYYKGKHYFMSIENIGNNFSYTGKVKGVVSKFQTDFILHINSLL